MSQVKCAFDGCVFDRMLTMNVCTSHRSQILRRGYMTPLQTKAGKPRDGRKVCSWCKEWISLDDFPRYSGKKKNKYYPACNNCKSDYNKYTAIRSKYKLTPEKYHDMIKDGCNACSSMEGLVVDHDHSCCSGDYSCGKCVRGILCSGCNKGLGHIRDSVPRLKALVRYLNRHDSVVTIESFPEMFGKEI